MIDLKTQKPAKRYADALFETSIEPKKNLLEIQDFICALENEELKSFLCHPVVKTSDKKEVIGRVFTGSKETLNFLCLLIDENRMDCLVWIEKFLKEKINAKNNLMTADITLAIEPDEVTKEKIKNRLQKKFNSNMELNFIKDEKILGGMLIKVKDTVIDLSIKKKIEKFKTI